MTVRAYWGLTSLVELTSSIFWLKGCPHSASQLPRSTTFTVSKLLFTAPTSETSASYASVIRVLPIVRAPAVHVRCVLALSTARGPLFVRCVCLPGVHSALRGSTCRGPYYWTAGRRLHGRSAGRTRRTHLTCAV